MSVNICAKCETNPLPEGDYLCLGCRHGIDYEYKHFTEDRKPLTFEEWSEYIKKGDPTMKVTTVKTITGEHAIVQTTYVGASLGQDDNGNDQIFVTITTIDGKPINQIKSAFKKEAFDKHRGEVVRVGRTETLGT